MGRRQRKQGWLSLQKGLLWLHVQERFDLVAWGLFWSHGRYAFETKKEGTSKTPGAVRGS